jgi:hypothetical protein
LEKPCRRAGGAINNHPNSPKMRIAPLTLNVRRSQARELVEYPDSSVAPGMIILDSSIRLLISPRI